MTRERAWPVRVMYILIAAALAMSLMIMAAPAQKLSAAPEEVEAEWDRVSTPTIEDWVVAPESIIFDYALADGGDVAYAVVGAYDEDCVDDAFDDPDYRLLKSDDGAATWEDLTEALEDELDDDEEISALVQVATDWEDPDFVAVALALNVSVSTPLHVFFSIDGGDSFEDAEEVEDGGVYLSQVSDLAVSYEEDDERDIAIGGIDDSNDSGLFRCTVTGDKAGKWEDATDFDGWDDDGDFDSELVTDIIFSPSWATDNTILVTTVDIDDDVFDNPVEYSDVHLQCGSWGTSPGWNEWSTLGIEAVPILEDEDLPLWLATLDARAIAGITLPEDYDSDDTDARILWVWVNYYDGSGTCMCQITRVEDDSAGPLIGGSMAQVEDGELFLTNISYKGTIEEGEAIAGVLGTGTCTSGEEMYLIEDCCVGVQVYHNDGIRDMDICCERWRDACKPPTGQLAMAVSYVGEDKVYGVALWGMPSYEEGAWSVTFDDGDTWNQLSLIDTYISYFSDVAVSPDCNKTMLVSVNVHKVCIEYDEDQRTCDSVWLYAEDLPEAEEYSGKWLRTWCGELEGDDWWHVDGYYEAGMLRLAPEETTGDTVYLFDYGTSNVYWNDLETLACWDAIKSTEVDEIVDLAAQDADTVYALDAGGDVSMFDDDEWYTAVESKVDDGYTIAVWGDYILVGGEESDVSYSDDGGETFTALDDVATVDCYVTVAFDSYFDTNNTIFAGLDDKDTAVPASGVYRWIIDESEAWKDLRVEPLESLIGVYDADTEDETVEVNITGLVLDRPDPGNPMTSPDTGGVLYASYYGSHYGHNFTGVARYLTPAEDVVCKECGDWDYLIEGLTIDVEGFEAYPDAVKICGCLEATSNSKLFAIDAWWDYDICDGEDGAVWMFEDCYAKKAPDLTSPTDGEVIDADPCSCYSEPFTFMWDRLCDACSYDLQVALDEDFDEVVLDTRYFCDEDVLDPLCHYVPPVGDAPAYHVLGGPDGGLSCETTYYWRVRAADAETDQIIHSWWSDPWSVTIGPSVQAGEITLVSPEPGATGVAIKNVGFSWDLLAEADAFDWVLDNNSDLSSPVESQTGLTDKAYECTQTLSYSTTYYWQVTAYNEGAEISTSAIGTFTTAATGQFCCPQCGLCFDTQAELQAHIDEMHPAQPAIPTWVWIVIAIGAVLVIVVIVLIFRTRRV